MIKYAAMALPALYLASTATLYAYQDRLLYNPDPVRTAPATVGLHLAKEIELTASDGTALIAWHTPAAAGMPTILFLHGKGGALKDRLERYRHYAANGFGVFFLSYRGYGGSAGTPSETGLVTDATAAYDWLIANGTGPGEIAVVGESLGTGVAVQLAARQRIAALALEAPYASVAEVAAERYWWVPVNWLIKDRFDSHARIDEIGVPVLIHHGDADTTVPIASGRKLFAQAREPKQFVELAGRGHAIFTAEVFDREMDFFREAMRLQ
jgi:hypothetical protein